VAKKLTLDLIKRARHSGRVYAGANGTERPAREVLWDTEVRGLGVRLFPNGRRTWVLRYHAAGRERVRRLSRQFLTLAEARALARTVLAEVARGEVLGSEVDPLARRERGSTVAEVAKDYLADTATRVRHSTAAKYRDNVRNLVEHLGACQVDSLAEVDAQRMFSRVTKERGPFAANRCLSALSGLLAYAVREGLRPRAAPDPVAGVKRNPERGRGVELTGEQLARIGRELDFEEAIRPDAADTVLALRLLFLTGCRRREICDLRWSEVDLESRCLRLRETKTGPRTVALNTAAAALLAAIPRAGERVFSNGRRRVDFAIQYTWSRVRRRAGLEHVRIHDARHSYVTRGLAAGYSEALVGKAVGHASAATTRRYSHLSLDPVREVAERVGGDIAASLEGREPASVAPLKRTGTP